MIGIKDTTSDH